MAQRQGKGPLELIDLECFVTLAEELHFGRTAARLHMGTPSVSKRIAELEHHLGVRLFDRTSREVRITPAGRTLLGQAQRALAEMAVLHAMAADAAAGAAGAARAAYSPGTGELMTALTRALRARAPDVVVHPEQMISLKVAAAVRSGAAAIGIARVPPGPDLSTLVLARTPLNSVAMPVTHPLAARDRLTPADLSSEVMIGPPRSIGGARQDLPSARFRDVDVSTEGELFDLVSSGYGLFVTSEGTVRRNPRHDIVVRRLVDCDVTAVVLLIWRPDDDSPVVGMIRQVAAGMLAELTEIAAGMPASVPDGARS